MSHHCTTPDKKLTMVFIYEYDKHMVCKSCGKENKTASSVCESCGAQLTEQSASTDTQTNPQETSQSGQKPTDDTPTQSSETPPTESSSPDTQSAEKKPEEVAPTATAVSTADKTMANSDNSPENTSEVLSSQTTTTEVTGTPVVVQEKKSSKYLVIGIVIAILLTSILAAFLLMNSSKTPQPDEPLPTKEPVPTDIIPTREVELSPTIIPPTSAAGPTKTPSVFNSQSAAALTQMMTSGNAEGFKQAFANPENIPTDAQVIKAFQTVGNFEFDPGTFKEESNGTATVDAALKVPGTDMRQAMEVTLTNVDGAWKISSISPKR